MARFEEGASNDRRRRPSKLAQQLADAFEPCSRWSEVHVERRPGGELVRFVVGERGPAAPGAPFDWATG